MRLRFLWVGKTRNSSINRLILDYLERVRRLVSCEVIETRDGSRSCSLRASDIIAGEGKELARYVPEHSRLVVLDEEGTQFSSAEFARWLNSEHNRGARIVTFITGGPDGLSPMICRRADVTLSLGKMTWTHEMCRALLLEQVYRALCILRNIPYHRS